MGITTIRASRLGGVFSARAIDYLDQNLRPQQLGQETRRWLDLRLEVPSLPAGNWQANWDYEQALQHHNLCVSVNKTVITCRCPQKSLSLAPSLSHTHSLSLSHTNTHFLSERIFLSKQVVNLAVQFFTALFCILAKDSISPQYAGLALTKSLCTPPPAPKLSNLYHESRTSTQE